MRIIHLFVILSIFLFGNVFASAEKLDSIGCTLFCCIYKHKVKTTDLNGKNVNDSTIAILEVGDNVSKYEDYSAYQGKRPSGYSVDYMNGDPRSNDGMTIYQNFPQNGKQTIREGLLPNFYLYEEQLNHHWVFVDGQDSILGYRCKKAFAKYAGRTWLVYYTEDIPSINGPWKLSGLPGLILKAESEDGTHEFIAQILFNVKAQNIYFEKEERDIIIERNKFITFRNRLKCDKRWAKNAGYYMSEADIRSIIITQEKNKYGLAPSLNINGISLPISGGYGHLYKPLELK